MRVSISGSHSTGKTTLSQSITNLLHDRGKKSVGLLGEVARQVISMGFPLNQDATIHSYLNYIWLQLKEERARTEEYVISDRSLVDLLGYIRTNNDPNIPGHFVAMLEELLWRESSYFDLYCYLPVEFPLVVDQVRPDDVEYQKAVDNTIYNILQEYGLPYNVITGSVEERCEKIFKLL